MSNYPVVLVNLERGAVVVGGGQVAARKVEGLLDAGVGVTVIGPLLAPILEQLASQGRINVVRRTYVYGDLAAARLVIAATDDPQVNQAVWQEAQACGCLVNVVDDPAHCNFFIPAVVRRGMVTVAVGTVGASPTLARRLGQEIQAIVGPEYGPLAALLAALRPRVQAGIPPERHAAFWRKLIDALLPLLRQGDQAEARQVAEDLLKHAQDQATANDLPSVVTTERDSSLE
jgi:precorrin-2 dehydrogenase/sirohydrochlorin ferrochelatase